jgi:hypothetical protein
MNLVKRMSRIQRRRGLLWTKAAILEAQCRELGLLSTLPTQAGDLLRNKNMIWSSDMEQLRLPLSRLMLAVETTGLHKKELMLLSAAIMFDGDNPLE